MFQKKIKYFFTADRTFRSVPWQHCGRREKWRQFREKHLKKQSQNTLDPEMAQGNISQVSEEIKGRVNKKLSKDFGRTESRILGALSKFDEILLNPQVRTCSEAVPGTSRNSESEKREPTGDRSLSDPCLEAVFSTHRSVNLNCLELEETNHMVTGVQKEIPYCSTSTSSEKQKRRAPQVSHYFAVKTPLRQMKQTRSC